MVEHLGNLEDLVGLCILEDHHRLEHLVDHLDNLEHQDYLQDLELQLGKYLDSLVGLEYLEILYLLEGQ